MVRYVGRRRRSDVTLFYFSGVKMVKAVNLVKKSDKVGAGKPKEVQTKKKTKATWKLRCHTCERKTDTGLLCFNRKWVIALIGLCEEHCKVPEWIVSEGHQQTVTSSVTMQPRGGNLTAVYMSSEDKTGLASRIVYGCEPSSEYDE